MGIGYLITFLAVPSEYLMMLRPFCKLLTFVPSIFVILGSCVFRIIWIYTAFAHFKTIESLFAIYPFSWAITAIFEIIYFVIAYKKETAGFKK